MVIRNYKYSPEDVDCRYCTESEDGCCKLHSCPWLKERIEAGVVSYVVKLELPELRDAVSVFRRESNNINQITKRVNSTGRVYDVDVRAVQESLDRQWAAMNVVLEKLASIP